MAPARKLVLATIMLALMAASVLAFLELAVRLVLPQPELYPRYRYSERFGHLLPASATIVNRLPGAWRFVYRTNEYGFRVSMPGISNRYDLPNVVVLGDSYTFGVGVHDGEEYPALLSRALVQQAGIVNLGVGGFGLTQQIRAFYEFGVLFQPAAVVLQFCSNDPDDNFYARVTTVDNGRFRFHRDRSMGGAMALLKDWLSGSIIQRSAAYNLVRNHAYWLWEARVIEGASATDRLRKEDFHNELLGAFAADLRARGVALILFDVPGQLGSWPGIKRRVEALERSGELVYLPSERWFDGLTDYGSPEGHALGVRGHRVIAERLEEPLRAALRLAAAAEALP